MLNRAAYDWDASFDDLLRHFRDARTIGSEEVVGAIRSLLEDCRDLHDNGQVAALDRIDLLAVTPSGELALGRVSIGGPIEAKTIAEIDTVPDHTEAQRIGAPGEMPRQPLYCTGYTSWERLLGHHDALTDIFHLGMLMASLATRLDFRDAGDLAQFVRHKGNLCRLNPHLHPVLARVISDMTKLRRSERAADLSTLIDLVDDYRSVEVDDAPVKAGDLADLADPALRRERTQEYFRNRLFEVTRRNKLLYFADRHGVNLTRGSLLVMLDYKALQPRQLLTANSEFLQRLAGIDERDGCKGELDLRRWLQCADYPFLAPSLDKMRSAARKDSRELGFNQLRLVLAFLHWHDDERGEPINSPLVMLPVTLKKQAGTSDGFSLVLEAPIAEAEINPVLRYILNDRYRLLLPDTIDLAQPDAIREIRNQIETTVGNIRQGLSVRLSDVPRITLLQSAIRQQLDEHRRRQRRAAAPLKDWRGIGYSYAADSYQPLGLELFDRFVRPSPAFVLDGEGSPPPDVESGMPTVADLASAQFHIVSSETAQTNDPNAWEIDLCAVTLANFNTRKMSLVRDYEILLDGYAGSHANYRRLFECDQRPDLQPADKPPHTERNTVLPSDPSQDDAVLRAAKGESYVIQGPPGTGKSQTIANLLADLAANGKSVLFVCEKRVALDVVHKRLREAGIGDLASLVHDAREDRIGFIADLKVLYESWLASRANRTIRDKRASVTGEIENLSNELRIFSSAMQRYVGAGDTTARTLMEFAIECAISRPRTSLREREATPSWSAFVAGERELAVLDECLASLPVDRERVIRALSALPQNLLDLPDAADRVERFLPAARRALNDCEKAASSAVAPKEGEEVAFEALFAQSALAARMQPLAVLGRLDLLDPSAPVSQELRDQFEALDDWNAQVSIATAQNKGWRNKPVYAETRAWLAIARRHERGVWRFFSSEWRALQQTLDDRTESRPANLTATLESMMREHEAIAARDRHADVIRKLMGTDDLDALRMSLADVWNRQSPLTSPERALLRAAAAEPATTAPRILALAASHGALERAHDAIFALFPEYRGETVARLAEQLDTLDGIKDRIIRTARALRDLDVASPALGEALRRAPMTFETLRGASLHLELQRFFAQHPAAQRTNGRDLQRIAETLDARLAELRTLNARRILDERKSRFRARIGAPNADYDVGRAFLEHQFSLFRPSAALRDFLTGAPGVVVRDLKPIWMMSPLSVADTLPLDENLFDVVVFDEASQIPIEDALPTLYRAPQMVVVGDEMQLPPPSYFGRKLDSEDIDLPDYIAFGMQAESLLDKAAAALPATRLEWHYRSRHESLIGFCNQAFYGGRLRTIPSRHPLMTSDPIDAGATASIRDLAQRVLNRPISFHRLTDATYVAQHNVQEASYIANLVRALLSHDASKTIGIVAFSQAQQAAIEDAIERLAAEHAPFRNRLERALGLDQEELFVKNLENVQGDERDIIIVSIAYGPGASGRMIMNFGPINQDGGEKRLNVIFSRAKHHVAVVSSFDPEQITNDWNKGAKALKRYLMYAAAASTGNAEAMQNALDGYAGASHIASALQDSDPLAAFVADTLRRDGRSVVCGLGQSTARCDVALQAPGGGAFTTAILTDNARHYAVADVIDRYVTYPGLLRSAGWTVEFALAKDWLTRVPQANAE